MDEYIINQNILVFKKLAFLAKNFPQATNR